MRFSSGFGNLGLFKKSDDVLLNSPEVIDFEEQQFEEQEAQGNPAKVSPKERRQLNNQLASAISDTYYPEVPCLNIHDAIEASGEFTVSFGNMKPCRTNPAFIGDIHPREYLKMYPNVDPEEVFQGRLVGTLNRVNPESEINNAMVVVTWQYEENRGPGKEYELVGYVS